MTAAQTTMSRLGRLLLTLASAVAVLAGMRIAAPILGPVLIALMITIAWTPGSQWLRRHGWPSSVAALTGIVIGMLVILIFVGLVWSSLIQLQDKLPGYQPRIESLQQVIRDRLSDLPIESSRLFTGELLRASSIVTYGLTTIKRITQTAGTVIVLMLLMAFMMIEATRFPGKLKRALSSHPEAIEQLTRFGDSIRGYLVINAAFGLVAAIINTLLLIALGVDFPLLWGLLSFLLSFVPNVGFLIALVPPALMALVEAGFIRAAIVVGAYTLINFVVDNVIKPRFVGHTVDLSPLIVVVSLFFWGWLLGPMGALVAVPLTIALKFFFESFTDSRWLAHLMSDAGPRPSAVDEPASAEKGAA